MDRRSRLCVAALAEPRADIQLAAVRELTDPSGLDRPDLVIDAVDHLLPAVLDELVERRDSLLREARKLMATGQGSQRLRACQVIVRLGGPGAAPTLVTDLADPIPEIRDRVAAELLRLFRELATAAKQTRDGSTHPLSRDGWEPGLWAAYESVLVTLPRHARREFFAILPEFGDTVVPVLAKVLASEDDGPLREAAMEAIGETPTRDAVELVLGLAAHHKAVVQEIGRTMLDGCEGETFATLVAEVVADRGEASANAPWARRAATVATSLTSTTARKLIELLVHVSDEDARNACAEKFLQHPNHNVRFAAAARVVEWNLPNRAALLAPLVGSEHRELRQLAVREVSKVGFELYLDRFDGMNASTREAAARAVAKIDDSILVRLAEEIRSLDARARFKALRIVGYIDAGEDLRAALMGLLSDADRHVRATALRIVELTGSIPGMKALIDALSDSDRRVRANAIDAFADLDDDCYLEIFVPFLQDRDNRVRANAAKALWNVGYEPARDTLAEMLDDDDPAMRQSAIWALGELRCDGALELLDRRRSVETEPDLRNRIEEVTAALANEERP